jgi:acetyl/propionyl-CoA carboxylase alpha subunit
LLLEVDGQAAAVALLAETGVRVEKGASLMILEARKMEHTIAALVDYIVEKNQ